MTEAQTPPRPVSSLFLDGQEQARHAYRQHPGWSYGLWQRQMTAVQQAITHTVQQGTNARFWASAEMLRGYAHTLEHEILPEVREIAALG